MKYNPDIHHRQSIRLRDFDYSATVAYFVTLCVQGRECLFGSVHDGLLAPNEPGED
jgi:putative transposase